MESTLAHRHHLRQLVGGWWLLALLALGASTLFAVLLIVARSPALERFATTAGFFREALVMHVNLAVVVWFLSCAAGLWVLFADRVSRWHWLALGVSACGLAMMLLAVLAGQAVPVIANYVPVLDAPLFIFGLAAFLAGVVCSGAIASGTALRRKAPSTFQAWRYGAGWSLVVAAVAVCALLASLMATAHMPASDRYEALAWAPGHVLQFVHVLLLMSAWVYLAERMLGQPVASQRVLKWLFLIAALPVLTVPVIYFFYPVGSTSFRNAFTTLMSAGAWPAAVALGLMLLSRLARSGASLRAGSDALPLLLSIALFLCGCLIGAAIRSETTMVPAHYHCTVGAVTLAYMATGYRMLAVFGFRPVQGVLLRWQPLIYGAGLLMLAFALAWSGWLGVPRKTMSVDLALESPAYLMAMGLAGVGGFLAILGSAAYVFNMVRGIWWQTDPALPVTREKRVHLPALAVCAFFLMLGGMLVARFLDRESSLARDAEMHVRQQVAAEVAQRFEQGVMMLHAKHPEEALTAFHRVIELAPEMPEAHVNMGYALLDMHRYEAARDFFESATVIRPNQVNAYYGLAEALEGLEDIPGALGAMRTYIHLAPAESPYRRKAEAAVWEWEARLQKTPPPGQDGATEVR